MCARRVGDPERARHPIVPAAMREDPVAGGKRIMACIAAAGLAAFLLLGWVASAQVLEMTPAAWDAGDWIEAVVTGSPLAAPDSISLRGSAGELIPTDQIESVGDTITFLLDLRQAAPGWYDLRLATLSGAVHTEPHCFEVRPLAPPPAWSEPVRLTEEPEPSERPKLAVDLRDRVHVVWQNRKPSSEHYTVLYRRWTGSAWTDTEHLIPADG